MHKAEAKNKRKSIPENIVNMGKKILGIAPKTSAADANTSVHVLSNNYSHIFISNQSSNYLISVPTCY